jgi:hypothetical protein
MKRNKMNNTQVFNPLIIFATNEEIERIYEMRRIQVGKEKEYIGQQESKYAKIELK